ncbi:hypothetical protein H6G06_09250 [Anabaena sphaerica FACHB-251]|uniref:SPOR domain-containing protein n=1 Tax=Anabaena sphaerica FACHB-251 TaxID=2692883 RepID=A0A926WFL1_9NOST|nr:hypothetical protein [Anabaena sphaerica]MBD2293670.1 hypothetical protein [Anabaena sphaerica FACHB-251]
MPSFITHQITTLPILSSLVVGYLALTCQDSLAQTRLPQLQPAEAVEFNQNNQNYQPSQTTQISQYGQDFERYVVYVDSDNSQILQRVRQIESSAYIRQFNGRNIIQSGVFSKPYNAEQRVRELELNGISGAGILNFSNQEQTSYYSTGRDDFRNVSPSVRREQAKYYYVIIPSSSKNLRFLRQEIQQKIDGNTNVFMRTQPRGAHIAVGGFKERQEAEQWNNYIRNLGYRNARVYYGK